jgi:hypothetical protein
MRLRSIAALLLVAVLATASTALAQILPATPTGLSAQVVGATVTLSWDAAFLATGYRIEAGSGPGLSNLGQLSAGAATALAVPGVPVGNYFVRVRATNAAGASAASPDIVVTVGAACALPAIPSGLAAAVAGSAVSLQWSGTGPFRLEAGTAPGASNVFAGEIGVATTLAAAVAPGAYFARVHARNGCGLSLASNEVLLSVLVPEAPTALTASTIGATVTLRWTAPAGPAPAGFVLEAGSAPGVANIASLPLAGTTTTLAVPGVPNGVYYVRVRAASAEGIGAPSNELTLVVGPPGAGTSTVTFTGLAGTNTTPFTSHAELGYLVEPVSGPWTVLAGYGRPAPSIKVERTASDPDVIGAIRVRADDASTFRLATVDLYSSITTIPYVLTGTRGGVDVFTATGTVPNTFGNFATVTNPFPSALIDTLIITVTNPQCTLFNCSNPVGVDNIVVWH